MAYAWTAFLDEGLGCAVGRQASWLHLSPVGGPVKDERFCASLVKLVLVILTHITV